MKNADFDSPLFALSPADGRYARKTDALRPHVSEFGLIRYRVLTEIRWLEVLTQADDIPELNQIPDTISEQMQRLATRFEASDAETIKTIEHTTNHAVKA